VGEIGIKGKNRIYFVRKLRRNIRRALANAQIGGQVWSEGQRIYVEVADEEGDRAAHTLQYVFGVTSLSQVHSTAADLDAIRSAALELARKVQLAPPTTFRIQARRADKSFAHTSPEIGRLVGHAVGEMTGAPVDLSDDAGLTIGVEVRPEGALVYADALEGAGGMPLGSQGRAFALLSGGIDSPVAMWLMMKRGCGIIPIHFAQSEVEKQKALDNCRLLERWSAGWTIKPIILDHQAVVGPVANRLAEMREERWTCIFCKRAMIAAANELAPKHRVQALVMGDSLGQVASQTLSNMAAISWQAPLPILRPLIALDKDEIMALGRRIGTYEISTRDSAGCVFLPHRPITRADLDHLQEIVRRLED
jgi:thiamine biosynthesis protein ThiI